MIEVTRRYRFAASHRLHSPSLSEDENRRLYGKCNNPFGHGHDYVLDVTTRGPVDEETGLAVPHAALDALVERAVLAELRNANLNDLPVFSAARVPTTESLLDEIRRRLGRQWPAGFPALAAIRIQETKRNRFESRQEEA